MTMANLVRLLLLLTIFSITKAQQGLKEETCNLTLSIENGLLMSPGYPSNYPNSTKCSATIQAPANHRVVFTFNDIDMEYHVDCRYDWVGIFEPTGLVLPNGAPLPDISHGYYCGSSTLVFGQLPQYPPITSTVGNSLTVVFSSDASVNGRGFLASFYFDEHAEVVDGDEDSCHSVLMTGPGEVTSPGYPYPYPNNKQCFTEIVAPEDSVVSLVFLEMSIEYQRVCAFDRVVVYDGATIQAPVLGEFCGETVPNDELVSTSNYMTIVFTSDISASYSGFRAVFTFRVLINVTSVGTAFQVSELPDNTICHCDDVCPWFEDCCHGRSPVDDQTLISATSYLPPLELWKCTRINVILDVTNDVVFETVVDYLLVSSCPSWWLDDDTRSLCENPDPDVGTFLEVYVPDEGTGEVPIFFRNLACVICNDFPRENDSLHQYMELRSCNTSAEIELVGELRPEEGDNNKTLCGSLLDDHLPVPRACISSNDIVKSCPPNSPINSTVLELCQANAGVKVWEETIYWNVYCLMCNVEDYVEAVSNSGPACFESIIPLSQPLVNATIQLVENNDGNVPSHQNVFLSSNVVLGFTCPDGFSNQDGRCVPDPVSWPSCAYENWTVSYIHEAGNSTSCYSMTDTIERFHILLSHQTNVTNNATGLLTEIYYPKANIGYQAMKIRTKYWMDIEFAPRAVCSDLQFRFSELCGYLPSGGNADVCTLEEYIDDYNEFQPLRSSNLTLVLYDGRFIAPSFIRRTTVQDVNGTTGLYTSRDILMVCGSIHPFEDCLSRVVEPGEFVITSEKKLIFDRLVFPTSDYTLQEDGTVRLCWSGDVSFFDFTKTQRLVANVAFGVSSMCLFATLVIYLIFPTLRNIHGVIMINFLVTFLISQIVVEFGTSYLTSWPALCQIMAIIGHFSFLSSFLWTNVLVWNLKIALVDARSTSYVSTTSRLFYIYAYAMGLPAVVVLGSLFLHLVSDGPVTLHYGGTADCWIYPIAANYIVMLGPMAICLFVNIILCVWIIVGFRRNMRKAETLRPNKPRQKWTEALIYLKISVLLGFGWGFGFAAANTYHKALWYVFILINSFQGIFIFLAFGMNKRVRNLIAERARHRQTSAAPTADKA